MSQSTPTMSETTSLNEIKVHFDSQSEGGERSGRALEGGPALDPENSKSPSINATTTSLNKEGEPSPAVPVEGKQSDETIENLVTLFRDFLQAAPNPATSNHTHIITQRNVTAGRNRFFGLNKGLSPETGSNNRYDYEQKYPRDRSGEEAADNARVWLTYLDEAEAFDRERVEGWKETADVLLVFAGLFSGVITTFVSQASQSLQQDNTQVSASLLFEIAQILRAQLNGTPINMIPNSTLTPTSPFTPSSTAFLVNGLWFTSLAITLSTALFAVLAKQWLYYYLVSITGTAHEKARARQLRLKGFESWRVGAIVDLLPILLQLAVGMFLTGIIILLFPLDIRVAWTIVIITGITYSLYFISVILPIRYPECPYITSLTIYVGIFFFVLRESLRWIGAIFDKGFRAVWGRIHFEARRTIQRLVHYTQGLVRHAFMFISKLFRLLHRGFRTLRLTIFTEEFPKFTKWREENVKKAVKNAAFLDFEALDWLYVTSSNRSVHQIIARCVAVHPIITGRRFGFDIHENLSETLEISETNVADLRYGLCLDLLVGRNENWALLRSIPDVVKGQPEEAEYRSCSRIAQNVIYRTYDQILDDAIKDNLEFPLIMWRYFLKQVPRNATMAAHILVDELGEHRSLFKWKSDPNRETIRNAGVVSFRDINKERGWWKFDYIYRFFLSGDPEYSLDKSFETRYLLLVSIYRNLASDEPLIADKKQRHRSLLNLFEDFFSWVYHHQNTSPKQYLAFFKDIYCADAFWSESVPYYVRHAAAECLDLIWDLMDTDMAIRFPFTERHDLSLIYKWYSQDYLDQNIPYNTPPMFTLLLVPQNRQHLSTILLNDPNAVSHLSKCFRNLRDYYDVHRAGIYIYPILMDLLKSVNPKMPDLFTVLYDPSVLAQLWKLLVLSKLDAKEFFLRVKSKLDQEKLDELHAAMTVQARSDDPEFLNLRAQNLGYDSGTEILDAHERSAHEFGKIIGVSHLRPVSTIEQSIAPEGAANRNHDIEERACQVPGSSKPKGFHSIADWIKQAFESVWSKTRIRGAQFTSGAELQDLSENGASNFHHTKVGFQLETPPLTV